MLKTNRFGDLRRSTLSWCRRTRISASNAVRDRNSPIKAHQINLQRSLIGSEYQPIRGRGQPFWVCGRDSRGWPSHAKFRKFKQKAHAAHSSLVTMLLSAVRMTSVSIQAAGYKEGSIRQLCRVAGYSTRPRHVCVGGGRSKVWDLQAGTAALPRASARKIPENFFARGRCSRQQRRSRLLR